MNPNLKILTDAIEFIERNLENNVSLQKTADNSNCSPQLLNKIFQGYCSFSTGAYIRKRILSKTAEELKHNNVSNTARKFNYDEPSFTRAFKKEFGVTPKEFKKSGTAIKKLEKIEIDKLILLEEIFLGLLEKLKNNGVLDYKKRYTEQIAISKIDEDKVNEMLESFKIPVPLSLIEKIKMNTNSIEEFKEMLHAVLIVSYLEYLECQHDVSKMKWSLKMPESVEKVDMAFQIIEEYYDFEPETIDEQLIAWFSVKKGDFILKKEKAIFKKNYNYTVSEEEMGLLLETDTEDFLSTYTRIGKNVSAEKEEIYFAFKAEKFLQYINDIGLEVKVPKTIIQNLNTVEAKALCISLHNTSLKCLERSTNPITIADDDVARRMFIVLKYYDFNKVALVENNYVYRFDKKLYRLLESIREVQQLFGQDHLDSSIYIEGISYSVRKQDENFLFELDEIFIPVLENI
ncbi:hypothetical protein CN488_18715 [Bacillus anthracis]|nr:hypothetical protein CN488_18715 [Bacillus anthracis]PGR18006.1 hypothetical protein COC50_25515 [Bacillus anthracis]